MKINDSLIIAYHRWLISLLTPISQIILRKDIIIQSKYENSFMFKRNKISKQFFFKRLYNNLIVYIHEESHCQFTVSSLVNCKICKIEKKMFFLNLHKPHTIKLSMIIISYNSNWDLVNFTFIVIKENWTSIKKKLLPKVTRFIKQSARFCQFFSIFSIHPINPKFY